MKLLFYHHNPIAELTPHHGCHDCSSKIRDQITWNDDIKARVWQEIIIEKIRKQYDFLKELNKIEEAKLLESYMGQVNPSDTTNREGHAAKVYFNALFGLKFTRGEVNPINAALNYGYSLILSAINREIAANGYLTQIGIYHSNMFNHYNLSCDCMEPFRVIVDRMVYEMNPIIFDDKSKHDMWNIFNINIVIDGTNQNFLNAIRIYIRSIFNAINDSDISQIRFYSL